MPGRGHQQGQRRKNLNNKGSARRGGAAFGPPEGHVNPPNDPNQQQRKPKANLTMPHHFSVGPLGVTSSTSGLDCAGDAAVPLDVATSAGIAIGVHDASVYVASRSTVLASEPTLDAAATANKLARVTDGNHSAATLHEAGLSGMSEGLRKAHGEVARVATSVMSAPILSAGVQLELDLEQMRDQQRFDESELRRQQAERNDLARAANDDGRSQANRINRDKDRLMELRSNVHNSQLLEEDMLLDVERKHNCTLHSARLATTKQRLDLDKAAVTHTQEVWLHSEREKHRVLRENQAQMEQLALLRHRLKDLEENGPEKSKRVPALYTFTPVPVDHNHPAAQPGMMIDVNLVELVKLTPGEQTSIIAPPLPVIYFTRAFNQGLLHYLSMAFARPWKKMWKTFDPNTVAGMSQWGAGESAMPVASSQMFKDVSLLGKQDYRLNKSVLSNYRFLGIGSSTIRNWMLGAPNWVDSEKYTGYRVEYVIPIVYQLVMEAFTGRAAVTQNRDLITRDLIAGQFTKFFPMDLINTTIDCAFQHVCILRFTQRRDAAKGEASAFTNAT